jgi:hypothetical protein
VSAARGGDRRWPRSRLLRALVALALTLVVAEAAAFVAVRVLAGWRPHLFYVPDVVGREEYERYLATRDPVLGWPGPARLREPPYDAAGSRPVPAYPDPAAAPTMVSLYGDSMTESLEVGDEDAWGNQLARLLGARVANYGVSGYGTDQAYLRFLANEQDHAPVVVLNHFSDGVLRNVNRWRYLISTSPQSRLTFKPRFLADGEGLDPVPLPALSYDAYVACVRDGARCLEHEYFLPDDGASGIQSMRFPFLMTLLRLPDGLIFGSRLRGEPRHADVYRPDHPSAALRVTRLLLRDFVAAARARGRTPVVTIIPDGKDLEYFRAHGAWTYQPLVDALRAQDGIAVLNFGPGILARLGERSPCEVVNRCYDHFNAEGYRMLAEIAFEHLRALGLVPAAARAGD